MVAADLAAMLADTVEPWQAAHGEAFADAFHFISVFLIAEYWLRLACAPGPPGADDRALRRARLGQTCSIGGVFDFFWCTAGHSEPGPRYQ